MTRERLSCNTSGFNMVGLYLVGVARCDRDGLLAVPVMLWLSWPSRSNVARLERALDAKGARSGLSEAVFGAGTGPSGGPMLPV